ncbi:serine hydrolase domain-containing protein [Sulfitobacter sabulilitoris]|uniref:Serine hydrolase n=1 Tax=Sulfitobacter sabulilitoris TaxID=2562655 RepID=A0A5S3PLU6_9RHOB|nr:serine hydrolase [Sulfitobacter sabulilitoris]TMM55321.1 serine hydrolase [Sulfitobacter sabulilitoris]
MRTFATWILRAALALALAALVIGLWKREEITRLLAVNSLFAEDRIVRNFSNMDAAFLTAPLPRGDGPVSALPQGDRISLPPGVAEWKAARSVTSLLVLKDGQIVHEDYALGTTSQDRRISWSVAKSFLSALTGVLLDEGAIASLDDPVTKYAPMLAGGAYDRASIRHVLNMASGVSFDEDYLDFYSDINRMGRVLAMGGAMDVFAASLVDTFADPGTDWQYVSIDTHVIGMVIRGATGRSVSDLLAEKIIAPLGLEQQPYYLTDGEGVAFVLGGLNMTTRDYARFGQMIAQGGRWQGRQIVPEHWIDASTKPTAPTGPDEFGYGYQWWIPHNSRPGEYMGRGIYGQYIYIDEQSGVVIATTAADRKFRAPGVNAQNVEIFRRIARSL